MKQDDFNMILNYRFEESKKVLSRKSAEYSHNGDKLYNFKVAGRIQGISPKKALWGMAIKHLVCIQDMVDDKLNPSGPVIDEKIGDMVNYLILLEAILKEENSI